MMKRKHIEAIQGIIYVLPSLILVLAFSVMPIFASTYLSFTKYNVMNPAEFIGWDNYARLLKDTYVTAALKNTAVYVLWTVPLQTILALVFAAFLAEKMSKMKSGGFLRSVMFIPVIVSGVTAAAVWRMILNGEGGLLNEFLALFGISAVNWLGSKERALLSICIVAVWKNVGYFLVIYYAGIMGISREIYEAARVDGASLVQQFFHITIPMLKPVTYLVVTLGIIWSFQVFDISYMMTGGGPGHATVTLVMGIYNAAFKENRMGYACGVAMLLFVIIIVINIIENVFFTEKKEVRR